MHKIYNFLSKDKSKSAKILDDIFFEMVLKSNIDLFVEAGAYDGQTSLSVYNDKKCKIVAFEANPYNYNNFRSNFLNTDIDYLNLAVSNENKELTFFIQTSINGEKVPNVKKNNSLKIKTNKNINYEEKTVQCITLDNFFKIIPNEVALWVDVEGLAYEVLSGASKLLKNTAFLKVEVEHTEIWSNQKTVKDVIEFLQERNFIPLIRDFEYSTQYNIIFVSSPLQSYYEDIALQVLNIG